MLLFVCGNLGMATYGEKIPYMLLIEFLVLGEKRRKQDFL